MASPFPPGLEALLGNAGSGPMMNSQPDQPDQQDSASVIRNMLSLADQYRQVEQDDQDLLAMEKVRTLLQQLLAQQSKEQDDMMQGRMSPRAARRIG